LSFGKVRRNSRYSSSSLRLSVNTRASTIEREEGEEEEGDKQITKVEFFRVFEEVQQLGEVFSKLKGGDGPRNLDLLVIDGVFVAYCSLCVVHLADQNSAMSLIDLDLDPTVKEKKRKPAVSSLFFSSSLIGSETR